MSATSTTSGEAVHAVRPFAELGKGDVDFAGGGTDRDSELVAEVFDERDPAVADYLRQPIPQARALGLQTSICGQAPSVYPEYAEPLVRCGIDAISVNMDVVDRTRRLIVAAETRLILDAARNNGKVTP
jgi:pyruvate, water dikinase